MLRRLLPVTLAVLATCTSRPTADAALGKRLAAITGCISCHGPKLDGHLFEEDPAFALAWSSNLSRLLPGWSDAQVEAVLRTGRRPGGEPLWFMPTFAHRELTAAQMRDLIAWLRTIPPSGSDHPPIRRGPQWAAAVRRGMQDSAAQADRLSTRAPPDMGSATADGRRLARLACAECHGPDLKGPPRGEPGSPPDLVAALVYTPAQFRSLIHQGLGRDGKPLAGMAHPYARERLGGLNDAEIEAIRRYLGARAA